VSDDRAKTDVQRLVDEHLQAVYAYAYRLAGSAPDAEDLTQQVFLLAQQRLDQLRQPEAARSWLFTILRNCFFKTRQRPVPVPATRVGLNLDAVPTAADDEAEIDPARLQEALSELAPEFRLVLTMFYFEDCSYREIAKQLELPIGTVMSRLARAKQHLRSRLFEAETGTKSKKVARM
jgi:RNA polymerase sigma-70 factor, ECF subfamily